MAGGWIKVEKSTPDKPELAILARKLNITIGEAFLEWFKVYCWADGVCTDGTVPFLSLSEGDRLAHTIAGTCAALASEEIGWLSTEQGGISFAKWERHNGQSAKTRALDAEKKRRKRKASRKSPEKVPKQRGQKKDTSSLLYSSLSSSKEYCLADCLKCEEFGQVWDLWVKHRQDIKKPLTPTSVSQQLAEFGEWGCERSVAAIRHTVKKGWQGIREPDETPLFGGNGDPKNDVAAQMKRILPP